jgi:hypothetical protein
MGDSNNIFVLGNRRRIQLYVAEKNTQFGFSGAGNADLYFIAESSDNSLEKRLPIAPILADHRGGRIRTHPMFNLAYFVRRGEPDIRVQREYELDHLEQILGYMAGMAHELGTGSQTEGPIVRVGAHLYNPDKIARFRDVMSDCRLAQRKGLFPIKQSIDPSARYRFL